MSTPDDDTDFASFKPYLAPGGLDADRFAPLDDPEEQHRRLVDLIASFPEPRPNEDTQDWWARAMAARTATTEAGQAGQFGPGVVSLDAWKARHVRATLVRRTTGFTAYGDVSPTDRPHTLPEQAILTEDQRLKVYYAEANGAIEVDLETVNLFALEEYGGGRPYLVSFGAPGQTPILPEGGAVFFSEDGVASLLLPDTPEVRARLGYVTVDEIR